MPNEISQVHKAPLGEINLPSGPGSPGGPGGPIIQPVCFQQSTGKISLKKQNKKNISWSNSLSKIYLDETCLSSSTGPPGQSFM